MKKPIDFRRTDRHSDIQSRVHATKNKCYNEGVPKKLFRISKNFSSDYFKKFAQATIITFTYTCVWSYLGFGWSKFKFEKKELFVFNFSTK